MQTQPVMAADQAITIWALPNIRFFLQEQFQAIFLDKVQVFDHAHVVFGAIAFIQRFQPFAGESLAFKTKADESFCQVFALVAHVEAVFPPGNASRAIFIIETLLFQIVVHRLITSAQAAIHPAGGDKVFEIFIHFSALCYSSGSTAADGWGVWCGGFAATPHPPYSLAC